MKVEIMDLKEHIWLWMQGLTARHYTDLMRVMDKLCGMYPNGLQDLLDEIDGDFELTASSRKGRVKEFHRFLIRHRSRIIGNMDSLPSREKKVQSVTSPPSEDGRKSSPPTVRCSERTKQLCRRLREKTEGWPVTGKGIPYHYRYEYNPVAVCSENEEKEKGLWEDRRNVWDFKYDIKKTSPYRHMKVMTDAVKYFAPLLKETFGEDCTRLTLLCLPCSNEEKYVLRFREFAALLCKETGLTNGCPYMTYRKASDPKHLGGTGHPVVELSRFWEDRVVILVDDVITSGGTIHRMEKQLREAGAVTLAALLLARTTYPSDATHE